MDVIISVKWESQALGPDVLPQESSRSALKLGDSPGVEAETRDGRAKEKPGQSKL